MREPEPGTIAAAAAGDEGAFVELIVLFQEPVWRFLTHLLGDGHLAEDTTQETFLRVHRGLAGFEGRSKFSTWVFGIARNTGLDVIRRRERRPRVVSDDVGQVAIGPAGVARAEVEAALSSLSVLQREAILIVEVLGFTYREASQMTGVPEGTFKSRVHQARKELDGWLHEGERAREM